MFCLQESLVNVEQLWWSNMFHRNIVIRDIYIHYNYRNKLSFECLHIRLDICSIVVSPVFNLLLTFEKPRRVVRVRVFIFQHSCYPHCQWHCSIRKTPCHQTLKLLDELTSHNIASRDEQWRYLRFSWTWSLLGWVVALQSQPGASTASHHLRVTLEIQISKSLHVTRYLTSMFVSQSNCYATLITKCWSREVYASGTEVKLIDLQLGFWDII